MNQHDTMRQLYRMADTLPDSVTAGRLGWDAVSGAARTIRLAAGRLHRIAESECNGIERYQGNGIWCGTWTDADQESADKRRAKAESAIVAAFAALFGEAVKVTFQGDPRGAPVQVWRGEPSESRSADWYFS